MRAADNRYRPKMFKLSLHSLIIIMCAHAILMKSSYTREMLKLELWFAIHWWRIFSIQSKNSLKSQMSVIKCISPMCKYAGKKIPVLWFNQDKSISFSSSYSKHLLIRIMYYIFRFQHHVDTFQCLMLIDSKHPKCRLKIQFHHIFIVCLVLWAKI